MSEYVVNPRLRRHFYHWKIESVVEQVTNRKETLCWVFMAAGPSVVAIVGSEESCDPEVDVFCRSWTAHVEQRYDDQFRAGGWQGLVIVQGSAEPFMLAVYEFEDGFGEIFLEVIIVNHGRFEMSRVVALLGIVIGMYDGALA